MKSFCWFMNPAMSFAMSRGYHGAVKKATEQPTDNALRQYRDGALGNKFHPKSAPVIVNHFRLIMVVFGVESTTPEHPH